MRGKLFLTEGKTDVYEVDEGRASEAVEELVKLLRELARIVDGLEVSRDDRKGTLNGKVKTSGHCFTVRGNSNPDRQDLKRAFQGGSG
ncbi:hypothetical protein L3N51_01458 [Metallosphaera sp. J1]|uniref:hypothetical protein n=1 Tax=Metallosphaera javensis (ex Hofmann et al. 2022) TaxID=99938 RepID=UPI001EDEB197|nr:hypothetical protein [Metallosphaera javensis (ex Hofmann et al. 2022)]MCG3109168.1 hypothetical protein [Metallosphaera javensis (ex Hofmann et al. 2022)]